MKTITTVQRNYSSESAVSAKDLCVFLSHYASCLLGCGATCIRLEKNVSRIAESYGCDVEITIMSRHVHVTVSSFGSDDIFTSMATVRNSTINFELNTRLSRLSWRVADRHLSLERAKKIFEKITVVRHDNQWLLLLLVSAANASFCRLFGGDMAAMCVVFLATFAGFMLKQIMLSFKTDMRLTVIVCGFVSTVIGATALLFSLGDTPAIALATSVLYLVPGIPFINSFSDMLYRHYICAFSRFMDAVVLTCCLSIGLCGGMLIMNTGMF